MPTDNVLPIDADAARVLARQPARFRWFICAAAAAWLGMLVPAVLFTPLPPLLPFLALALLIIIAEHRFVLFGDQTSLSGGIIVAVASVFVFAKSAPFAGPTLIASFGGLYLPHIRLRQFGLVVANCSAFGIAIACSSSVAYAARSQTRTGILTTAAILVGAVAAQWLANSALIGVATAARNGTATRRAIGDQLTSDCAVLFLAAGAAFAGVAGTAGGVGATLRLLVLLVILLAAFELRLDAQRRPDRGSDSRTGDPRVLVLCVSSALLFTTATNVGMSLAFVALFLALTFHQPWHSISACVLAATAGGTTVAAALVGAHVPVLAQATGAAVVTFGLLAGVELATRAVRSSTSTSRLLLVGATIPGVHDLPRITAAAFTASLVTFGTGANGLLVASGLVLAALGVSSVKFSNRRPSTDQDSVTVL